MHTYKVKVAYIWMAKLHKNVLFLVEIFLFLFWKGLFTEDNIVKTIAFTWICEND